MKKKPSEAYSISRQYSQAQQIMTNYPFLGQASNQERSLWQQNHERLIMRQQRLNQGNAIPKNY